MTKKIAFINQKGGVGKTTTTMQFMAYLTKQGKKVLAIDVDPQGNLTFNCGINTEDKNTLSELLLKECTFEECVQKTKYGDILPCDLVLAGREREISGKMGAERFLRNAVSEVENEYDYIVVDYPPALNIFTYNALFLVDEICIVMQAESFALLGVTQIFDTIKEFEDTFDKKIGIAGMLINMYQGKLNLSKGVLENLEQSAKINHFKIFESKISKSVKFPEAQASQQSIFDYAPNSKISEEYEKAFIELVSEMKGE